MAFFAVRSVSVSLLGVALVVALAYAQDPVEAPAAAPMESQIPASSRVFAATETVAIVGDQHILAGDLLGEINQMLAPYAGKVPEEQIEEQRQLLLKQLLPTLIDNKILYLEFLRKIPKEKLKEVQQKLFDEFDEEKLEGAMVRAKVNSPAELDQLLRKYGTSLDKQRRVYMEQKLGRAMMGRDITYKPEITHDEILAYYHEHAKDFDVQARAKWEQLTVRFANHQTAEDPTGKIGAWAKIASMGNEVLRNAKFDAVAKRHSEAPNADQGGQSDWITKGSLASLPLENAIFTLPLNQLSAIIEDDRSFHIVRVLEREEATRVDFVAAQEKIKEKIKEQKIEKQVNEYVAKLKAKTSVWTIYDNEPTVTKTATKPANNDAFVPRLQ